jgi:peroxiredoxin
VKRLEGKPFALLGVNSDSKERFRRAVKKENITWRSWWDGGNTDGPIAKAWNVKGWPTIYVIDAKGVIRYRDVRDKELDEAIEGLLKEIDTAK